LTYNYFVNAIPHTTRADVKNSRAGALQVFRIVLLAAILLFPLSARAETRQSQPASSNNAAFGGISLYPNI
jgi:hypothetical protein